MTDPFPQAQTDASEQSGHRPAPDPIATSSAGAALDVATVAPDASRPASSQHSHRQNVGPRSKSAGETTEITGMTRGEESAPATIDDFTDTNGNIAPGQAGDPKTHASEGGSNGNRDGQNDSATDTTTTEPKPSLEKTLKAFPRSFGQTLWTIITASWINLLLVFVPVGIAVAQVESLKGPVAFSMNAIAIIPLAGLLSFATESVAAQMGDAIGALMNVTFGNAVELIIFIIALVKNEIRIVQASLLGSILSNLLLILGMCFFFGGLRYREQLYNSTVTQMSACLLSLSVGSLVLPTAFHASFKDEDLADDKTLKVSRGTSVILLIVYVLYLLFQLKSHAYMYESTPQHIVDAESTPGPAAGWLDSSSSSSSSSSDSDTSSSSSSDSDRSRDTMRKRVKKVLRGGRRRKNSDLSAATAESPIEMRYPILEHADRESETSSSAQPPLTRISSAPTHHTAGKRTDHNEQAHAADAAADDESSADDERWTLRARHRRHKRKRAEKKQRKQQRRERRRLAKELAANPESAAAQLTRDNGAADNEPRRVDFALDAGQAADLNAAGIGNAGLDDDATSAANQRRAFPVLRGISVRNLRPSVFAPDSNPSPAGPVPLVRYGIRRTNSLPDRLSKNGVSNSQVRPPGGMFPARVPLAALADGLGEAKSAHQQLSRPIAIVLLLLSTALVAVCAEFMVDSIQRVTASGGVPEMFIGLIILPVVGNAAEHVTAITVAMKNKMDLAIGVAIGSSIQIALLVTPFVVILGWILDRQMTLYFTLFETVCLFVSAFIVNFLCLDGRSNFLEGALLCATYIIIAVVAYFSPNSDDANQFGE